MSEIIQICGNLYDVGGYLLLPDDGVFDLSENADREAFRDMAAMMHEDETLSVFGHDTVLLISAGDPGEIIPVPVHVLDLDEAMVCAVRRHRHEDQ